MLTKIIEQKKCAISSALAELNINPILKQIYANRNITDPVELNYELKNLFSYKNLKNIDKAVDLIYQAIAQNKHILIVGDYDVDGATATALAVKVLRAFGAKNIDFLIPNRFDDGYGLTREIVQLAQASRTDLLITVDNGISSFDAVEAANAAGIQVIITDHHLAGAILPQAAAIVNPNQPSDEFESKNLTGVGVIFYVMLALRAYLRDLSWFSQNHIIEPNLANFLDLVALGTIADIVSLDYNNRILVYQGLQRIRNGFCSPGIAALFDEAHCSIATASSSDLSFIIAPRLNAAGRIDDMSIGVHCLLTESKEEAFNLASQLGQFNAERKAIEKEMLSGVLKDMKIDREAASLSSVRACFYEEKWHEGVIGILASRLKALLHHPVVVFARRKDGHLRGSARSVSGLHIRDLLSDIAEQHDEIITKFGGHALAAGVTIPCGRYEDFVVIFNQKVNQFLINIDESIKILSDGELSKSDFSLDFAKFLRDANPWGQEFVEPKFDGEFEILEQRLINDKHLKLFLLKENLPLEAIMFNVDRTKWPNYRCKYIKIVYRLNVNVFRMVERLQLLIDHVENVT